MFRAQDQTNPFLFTFVSYLFFPAGPFLCSGFREYPQVNNVRILERFSPLHPKLDVDPPVQGASK